MKKFIVLIILLMIEIPINGYCSPTKRALVIGNSNYQEVPLRNPTNDANDITKTLEELGFWVTKKVNITQQEMEEAIRTFGGQIQRNDIVLFYFSGHGVQVNGINYLLPIGTEFHSEDEIKYNAVAAEMVLDKLEQGGSALNIIILDACRDNPFKRFRSLQKGLAQMSSLVGTLIAYATALGTAAYDGEGNNSPYTKHLLRAMKNPGLKIEELLKQVRIAVMTETNQKQVPWESSSLTGDFYFLPGQNDANMLFSDTFSDSSIKGVWTGIDKTVQLQNGDLLAKSGSWLCGRIPGWKNYIVEVDLKVLNAKSEWVNGGINFRVNTNGNYRFQVLPQVDWIQLGKWDNRENKWSIIKTIKQRTDFNKWYHIKVKIRDDSMQCYLDDQLIFDVSNTAFSSGYIALQAWEGEVLYDNIEVTKYE